MQKVFVTKYQAFAVFLEIKGCKTKLLVVAHKVQFV